MEPEEEKKKKLNEDVVVYLRKRSETDAPRYAARLHAYVDLHRKRSRAAAAKRRSENGYERKTSANRKNRNVEQKEKNAENTTNTLNAAVKSHCGLSCEHHGSDEDRMSRKRGDKVGPGHRSLSRSRSGEPSDKCGRRRKRKRSCSRRRRRRRSCRRKRRRRRSRRRRSCRRKRRRRRSCSRRRRRRSCRRRRKRRRGCR